jgi:hypothetical protein
MEALCWKDMQACATSWQGFRQASWSSFALQSSMARSNLWCARTVSESLFEAMMPAGHPQPLSLSTSSDTWPGRWTHRRIT